MAAKSTKLLTALLWLVAAPAAAQQGVPYYPQTLQSGTVVGRLSSGPGPTEAISTSALLNALFPNGSAASSFSASALNYIGSVSGTVTTKGQAAAGTYTLQWPSTVGISADCLSESVSGSVATLGWSACAYVDANNAFTGNNTHAGLETFNGTFQIGSTVENFPASGNIVGTTDIQTLTNKSIDAGQLTGSIPNVRLANSSMTIAGKSVALGGSYAPARNATTGNSPGAGTAAGPVMAGIGLTITPATSGQVHVVGNLTGSNSTASAGCNFQLAFGTGAAPAHNAAPVGTTFGVGSGMNGFGGAGFIVSVPVTGLISGLTTGTTYWIDIQYQINTGGTCTINNYSLQALEQ